LFYRPDDSICQSHQIKSGDYLIISSDGLFDNLYEDEIALIIQEHIDLFQSQNNNNNFKITSDLLDSACQLLVNKASKGNNDNNSMLIIS
jgi:serine/threonine protein phosphatase PrpC